tara:strand:- start:368 stop:1108 length:741 start_codon:yes stop_codon:yes gene_type:complete
MKNCLLCNSNDGQIKFDLVFLDKYKRSCIQTNCGSLYVENVDWLDEAYQNNIDPGLVQRVLDNKSLIYGLSKLLNIEKLLDYGGGSGLLTRLLRDYSINSYSSDKYVKNIFSNEYNFLENKFYDFINLAEIIEHFDDPLSEFNKILKYKPKHLLISTELYNNQNKDWWYFALDEGQHIYFYSKECLENFFNEKGYKSIIKSNYQFFYNTKLTFIQRKIISLLLNKLIIKLIRLLLVAKKPNYEEFI